MSPTRRNLLKVAGVAGLTAVAQTGAHAGAEQRVFGRKHDHVVMRTSQPGWSIHKCGVEADDGAVLRIDGCTMLRTDDGAWYIAVRPDFAAARVIDVMVDDPGATAFLDTFADLMTDLPAGGKYRFSDLAAQKEGVR